MKRALLSVMISIFLVVGYLLAIAILMAFNYIDLIQSRYLLRPLLLPNLIFFYFSPPVSNDFVPEFSERKVFIALLFFFSNVLIYSIPVYLIAGIIAKFRKKKVEHQDPPAPPVFYDKA